MSQEAGIKKKNQNKPKPLKKQPTLLLGTECFHPLSAKILLDLLHPSKCRMNAYRGTNRTEAAPINLQPTASIGEEEPALRKTSCGTPPRPHLLSFCWMHPPHLLFSFCRMHPCISSSPFVGHTPPMTFFPNSKPNELQKTGCSQPTWSRKYSLRFLTDFNSQSAPKAQAHAQRKNTKDAFCEQWRKKSMEGFGAGGTVLGGERRAISKARFACTLPAGKRFSCLRRATPPRHS